ncbi:MAG: hypothetical protein JNK82_32505 [Myxococcaceae bacterium]|nr:hypothetical protein [Myxococcaceae bacterium]
MAAETLCPSCGFGPIPEGKDTCPACSTQFAANPLFRRAAKAGGQGVRKDQADLEATRTTLGGITGAVEANPVPTAAVLAGATLTWVIRCVGMLSDRPEPIWPLGVAAIQMGVAMLLMVSAGPAKTLAQVMAVVQIGCAYLAGGSPVAQVGYGGVGVALLVMTVAEPGDVRRWVGTGAAVAMLFFGVFGVASA